MSDDNFRLRKTPKGRVLTTSIEEKELNSLKIASVPWKISASNQSKIWS